MASATPYDDELDEIQAKLQTLSPQLREEFLRTMARVYEEESWSLIDFLQQSRQEMTYAAREMSEEQDQLRSASVMLTARRDPAMQSSSSLNSGGGGGNSPRSPRSARDLNDSRNFDRERKQAGAKSSEDEESLYEYNKDLNVDEYHEEAEEAIKNMKGVEATMQKERAKQFAVLKMKKEDKLAKKKESENKATELIDRAKQITQVQSKDKEKQEQKIKEKLASKREKQQQQMKKSKNTAETSLSDDNWAVSYNDPAPGTGDRSPSAQEIPRISVTPTADAKPRWPTPRENPEIGSSDKKITSMAEVEN